MKKMVIPPTQKIIRIVISVEIVSAKKKDCSKARPRCRGSKAQYPLLAKTVYMERTVNVCPHWTIVL